MNEAQFGELQERLRRFRYLEECLLDDVRWRRFGTEIDLVFNYVWDDDGSVRARVLEEPHVVEIRFFGVETLELENHLTPAILDHPEELNWGMSEVALVELSRDRLDDRPGARVEVRWEGGRALRVLAAGMAILEPR